MLHTPSSIYMFQTSPKNNKNTNKKTHQTWPPPPPQKKKIPFSSNPHTPPAPSKKRIDRENHQVTTCTLVGVVEGEGYIQKFLSTVLVPPQLYISSTNPTAHTHTHKIKLTPFPKVFLSYLNLNESLKWPNIPIHWQTSPLTPTPHLIGTVMILFKTSLISKSGWTNTKQLIKYLFEATAQRLCWGSNRQPLELAN